MQIEEELRQMEGKTSWYEEQIRESAGWYEKLYCRISKEDAASPEFQASREKWSRIYEERTVDRIRRRSRHLWRKWMGMTGGGACDGDTDNSPGGNFPDIFPSKDGYLPVTKAYRCKPITYRPYNTCCKNVRPVEG